MTWLCSKLHDLSERLGEGGATAFSKLLCLIIPSILAGAPLVLTNFLTRPCTPRPRRSSFFGTFLKVSYYIKKRGWHVKMSYFIILNSSLLLF